MYISHVAQVSDTAQVTRQKLGLKLMLKNQRGKLVDRFPVYAMFCTVVCVGINTQYKLS